MVNSVHIIGRLGHPPSLRETDSGSSVTSFSVATDEKWTDKQGQKQEKTEWHAVVTFSKLAEICKEYLDKGSLVYISGKLQTRKWNDKDGNTRYTTEIVAREMKMLDSKREPKDDTSVVGSDNTISDSVPF